MAPGMTQGNIQSAAHKRIEQRHWVKSHSGRGHDGFGTQRGHSRAIGSDSTVMSQKHSSRLRVIGGDQSGSNDGQTSGGPQEGIRRGFITIMLQEGHRWGSGSRTECSTKVSGEMRRFELHIGIRATNTQRGDMMGWRRGVTA